MIDELTGSHHALALDRVQLSRQHKWVDPKGRVYIIITVEEIQNSLNCSKPTAVKYLQELETFGSIEKERQFFGRPNLLYVKKFVSPGQTDSQNREYFRVEETEKFSFLAMPHVLLKDDRFTKLSIDAKILYAIMLSRMHLSKKNNWVDEQDRVYINMSIEDVQDSFSCGPKKAVKLIHELETIGLVEKKRVGFGKSARLYLKRFTPDPVLESESAEEAPAVADVPTVPDDSAPTEVKKGQVLESKKDNTGSKKTITMEVKKGQVLELKKDNYGGQKTTSQELSFFDPIKIDSNYTDSSETDSSYTDEFITKSIYPSCANAKNSGMTDGSILRERIKNQIDYRCLLSRNPYTPVSEIDELVEMMVEVHMNHSPTIRIGKDAEYPTAYVKERISMLRCDHIEQILDALKHSTAPVRNTKAYILATLFNATSTISHYYAFDANANVTYVP